MILYMLKMKKREFEKYMNRFVYGITPILCIYKITVVFEMQKKAHSPSIVRFWNKRIKKIPVLFQK